MSDSPSSEDDGPPLASEGSVPDDALSLGERHQRLLSRIESESKDNGRPKELPKIVSKSAGARKSSDVSSQSSQVPSGNIQDRANPPEENVLDNTIAYGSQDEEDIKIEVVLNEDEEELDSDRMQEDQDLAPSRSAEAQNDSMQVDAEDEGDVMSIPNSDEPEDVGDEIEAESDDDDDDEAEQSMSQKLPLGTPAKDVEWDSRGFGSPEEEFRNLRGVGGFGGLSKRLKFGEMDQGDDAADEDENDDKDRTIGDLLMQMEEIQNEEEQVILKDPEEQVILDDPDSDNDGGGVEFCDDSSEDDDGDDVEFDAGDSDADVDVGHSDMSVDDSSPVKTKKSPQARRRGASGKRKRSQKTSASEGASSSRQRIIDLPTINPTLHDELLASPTKQPGTPTKTWSITDRALWEAARMRLTHLVAPEKGKQLAGREFQHNQIKEAVVSALQTKLGGSMFIHGIPGTGKTATVRLIMTQLLHSQEYDFNYIEINGMKLTSPGMAYSYLWYKLNASKSDRDKKKNPATALIQLGRHFNQASKTDFPMSVILLDEMDYLLSRDNNVIYNFMEWTQQETSRLYVIGIANTMNLPEQLSQKIQSRLGSLRVAFMPYNAPDLLEILKNRLGRYTNDLFDSTKVLELIARTEANSTGDARRLLELCKRVLEGLESLGRKIQTGDVARFLNTFRFIQTQENPKVALLRCSPLFAQLLVCCTALELKRTNRAISTIKQVLNRFHDFCNAQSVKPPNDSVLRRIIATLASQKILIVDPTNSTPGAEIELGIDVDDIAGATSQDATNMIALQQAGLV